MRRILALCLLAAISASACGKGTEPTPTVTGRWSGTFVSSGITISADLTLQESAGSVSGSGTLSVTGGAIAQTVTGTHVHPNVSLTLASTGFESANITATMTDATTMSGSISGSGFKGESLTLRKQ